MPDNCLLACVPIKITGFQTEKPDAHARLYYIGDHLIAEVKVMFYENQIGSDPAGYLFAGKLYRRTSELDQAVSDMAADMLLARWNQ